jgi:hypothetical protein
LLQKMIAKESFCLCRGELDLGQRAALLALVSAKARNIAEGGAVTEDSHDL